MTTMLHTALHTSLGGATAAMSRVPHIFGGMNALDWLIAVTLAVSTVTAFMRGLIRSLVSLAGVLLGVLAAAWYAHRAADYVGRWIAPPSLALILSFVLVLAAVYAVAVLVGKLLRGACSAVGLGFLDRLAGAAFGFARGVLLLAALMLPVAQFLPYFAPAQGSLFLPYLLPAAHGISFVLPRDFGKHLSGRDWLNHWNGARAATGEVVAR
jgi:membrane protein required for colicin V production